MKLVLSNGCRSDEAVPLDQPVVVVGLGGSRSGRGAVPRSVWKVLTHRRFSFSVRMKRSAQPLPSGARTKAGELSMPRKRDLALERVGHVLRAVVVADAQAGGDAPWRRRRSARRTPCRIGSSASKRVPCTVGVDADAFGGAVVDGDEDRGLALAGDRRGHVGAPHRVDRSRG